MGGDHLWEAVGSIGEVFSALALFLVLAQVRQARTEMRRSVLDSMSESMTSVATISVDPRVNSAYVKALGSLGGGRTPFIATLMERTGLTEEEARLVAQREVVAWQTFARALRHVDALTPDDLAGIESNLRATYFASPISRLFYENVPIKPEIRTLVDNLLAHSDSRQKQAS
jgi:hypothetical protein